MTKVMLVEDDDHLREMYGARLMAEGYDIMSARDGEEALALAVKEKPDLMLSDIMMPKISGFDMLDILRSSPDTKDIRVVMMTALSQNEDQLRAKTLGADKYLVKSQVTLEDVVSTIKEVLNEGSEPTANSTDPANYIAQEVSLPEVPDIQPSATPQQQENSPPLEQPQTSSLSTDAQTIEQLEQQQDGQSNQELPPATGAPLDTNFQNFDTASDNNEANEQNSNPVQNAQSQSNVSASNGEVSTQSTQDTEETANQAPPVVPDNSNPTAQPTENGNHSNTPAPGDISSSADTSQQPTSAGAENHQINANPINNNTPQNVANTETSSQSQQQSFMPPVPANVVNEATGVNTTETSQQEVTAEVENAKEKKVIAPINHNLDEKKPDINELYAQELAREQSANPAETEQIPATTPNLTETKLDTIATPNNQTDIPAANTTEPVHSEQTTPSAPGGPTPA